ncbi:MarR family transcriptional regulator [Leifsonia sp. Root227]|uniref:MarR family transcriptional regulator n=1 Tax=unclassified Leifsonia TaxID=2663824 RepID=UPI000701D764|nr:MarR family transcriptional regulator [Leifsonia sp. Root227]KRC47016.1 MarR family transcriptional regulator [Leifsonia sp. Root227]
MTSGPSSVPDRRLQRRAAAAVKQSLRDLRVQLSTLNHQVGVAAELRDTDLDCLDLISNDGPLSPSALARLAGLHPATLTGILDRLEKGGWIARDRDPADRRSVLLRALPDRSRDMFRLYAGMNARMDDLCAGYDTEQLELIGDFLQRATRAGRDAAERFGDESA